VISRLLFALKAAFQAPELHPLGRFPGVDPADCAQMYLENERRSRALSEERGGRYINLLQPYAGGGKRAFTRFETAASAHIRRRRSADGKSESDILDAFYDAVVQKGGERVIDLRGLFDDLEGEVYFDQVHFSDRGYSKLAEKVASIIRGTE